MSKSKFLDAKFKFWTDHKKNCLLYGRTGVGKTEIIREYLEKVGLKYGESVAYYSTHDNDFVGDPTKAEVILFDDLNDPQAQKAAHEVSGLKVWKGVPVTAYVWGTYKITNENEESEVPLAGDFEVIVQIPNTLNKEWFVEQFGERIANSASEWWDGLGEKEKSLVSPKMLAAALRIFKDRGDMRDVLPMQCNVARLAVSLNTGPVQERLEDLAKEGSEEKSRAFLSNENNLAAAMKHIVKSQPLMNMFLPLIPSSRLVAFMWEDDRVFRHVLENSKELYYRGLCKEILQANVSHGLCKKIRRWLVEHDAVAQDFTDNKD